ncbi:MAG TPA: ABC transporter ATP-binding protein [Methanosarcinales archaeon]|nr:ABC transporter ATP-binding protein [Methanosarcinales archaeon]
MDLLSVRNLRKHFGGVKAVDGCSLTIEAGTIMGLIGPNGAGKTTMFNLISGFERGSGEIVFKGIRINKLPSFKVAQCGIVRTFQIPRALTKMTVLENLMLAPKAQAGERIWNVWLRRRKVKEQERQIKEKSRDILRFFEISHLEDEYAGALSGGQKKLLEMARAMMIDPLLMMLDEPFAGVNPTLSRKISRYIDELREAGMTFLVIEHDIPAITRISDRIIVMNEGKILTEGAPEEVKRNRDVLNVYLGGDG